MSTAVRCLEDGQIPSFTIHDIQQALSDLIADETLNIVNPGQIFVIKIYDYQHKYFDNTLLNS